MQFPDPLPAAAAEVIAGLRERDDHERRSGTRAPGSLMAVSEPVARLLYQLVLVAGAQTIVEFGTSHGYSTLHLAAAAGKTGGYVHTVDVLAAKTAEARVNLRRAGLLSRVTLVTGDGVGFAAALPHGIDFVLVDYGADAFVPAFHALRQRTADGCVIFVDGGPDGYWDTGGGRALKALLDADPAFLVSVVPMHKAQLVAVKLAR